MAKKIAAILLGVLNAALIALIVVSAATGWRLSLLSPAAVDETTPYASSGSYESEKPSAQSSHASSQKPQSSAPSEAPSKEPARESSGEPSEAPSQESSGETSETSKAASSEASKASSEASKTASSEASKASSSESSKTASSEASKASSESSKTTSSEASKAASSEASKASEAEPKRTVPDAAIMSTQANATLREMDAFTAKDGWLYITDEAEPIGDFSLLTGGWRAIMISDPNGDVFYDFMNAELSGVKGKVTVTLNWADRYFQNGGATIDARGYPSDLNGTFDGKQIKAVGDGAIILVGFCYDPGTGLEYAWGEYTWTDGVKGYIGLIR